jgi:hypothetical protein
VGNLDGLSERRRSEKQDSKYLEASHNGTDYVITRAVT